jgi:hypothetical protein
MIFFFAGVSAAKKKQKSSPRPLRLERAQRVGGKVAKSRCMRVCKTKVLNAANGKIKTEH